MTRKMFAMITEQGTAAAETALCEFCDTTHKKNHLAATADEDVVQGSWQDCSENKALICMVCGYPDLRKMYVREKI